MSWQSLLAPTLVLQENLVRGRDSPSASSLTESDTPFIEIYRQITLKTLLLPSTLSLALCWINKLTTEKMDASTVHSQNSGRTFDPSLNASTRHSRYAGRAFDRSLGHRTFGKTTV